MKAFDDFKNMSPDFWSFIKYISERLKYTNRKSKNVKIYTFEEVKALCKKDNINASDELISTACAYVEKRASILNEFVKNKLMDAETVEQEYAQWEQLHRSHHYYCKLPMNKQKNEMKKVAFFTAIINILTEKTIRELTNNNSRGFNDDPQKLIYITDDMGNIIGTSSRRFDGAYPSVKNPSIVWEIKEYYYNKSFGSRIADGVYETQLDGFEFNEIEKRTGRKIFHVLFIDANIWWDKGKSYLCRIIDALNSGVVDEVIVGQEVLHRWPEILRKFIQPS